MRTTKHSGNIKFLNISGKKGTCQCASQTANEVQKGLYEWFANTSSIPNPKFTSTLFVQKDQKLCFSWLVQHYTIDSWQESITGPMNPKTTFILLDYKIISTTLIYTTLTSDFNCLIWPAKCSFSLFHKIFLLKNKAKICNSTFTTRLDARLKLVKHILTNEET